MLLTGLAVALTFIAAATTLAEAELAPVSPPAAEAGRLETRTFVSEALGEERTYSIYLPAAYDTQPGRRFPVIYVLHGLHGDHAEWFTTAGGDLDAFLDRMIANGSIGPLIAVSPDGEAGYWTNHFRQPTRRFGDYVAVDLIAEVDRSFRTIATEDGRAVAGVSMGGWGAMSQALVYKHTYAAAVSLGGALFEEPPTHREEYKPVWGSPADPEHWRRTSPLELMKKMRPARGNPGLYLHCGDDDRLGFLKYAIAAHRILAARRIAHELRVTDGGHTWKAWRGMTEDWLRFVDGIWKRRAMEKARAQQGSAASP